MSLFDCQFLSTPSANHSCSENYPCSFECLDQQENSNPHTDSPNDSSASYCVQEVTTSPSPSCSIQKNPEKKLHRAIYKGPDVFGKVLGPTADESILVGLQALMDMAGTLEFSTGSGLTSSVDDNPVGTFCSSREASASISQNSASCQCSSPNCHERTTYNSTEVCTDEFIQEVPGDTRMKPCQYMITHENIATAVNPRRSKCQQSQTRVLPMSMTCYNPDKGDPCEKCSLNMLPCPNLVPQKFQAPIHCGLRTNRSPVRNVRSSSPSTSPTSTPPCPCSKFYHQMTTISVLENSPTESPTCIPCPPKRRPSPVKATSPICPITCDVSLDTVALAPQEKKSVACEPCKETTNTPMQTLPLSCPTLCNVNIETESEVSQEKTSVACDCKFCVPVSAGVSTPPSKTSNVCKIRSNSGSSEEKSRKCTYSVSCGSTEERTRKCTCSVCCGSTEDRNRKCTCSVCCGSTEERNRKCTCSVCCGSTEERNRKCTCSVCCGSTEEINRKCTCSVCCGPIEERNRKCTCSVFCGPLEEKIRKNGSTCCGLKSLDEEKYKKSTCSVCCGSKEREGELDKEVMKGRRHHSLCRNKSCVCSLIPKGTIVADATCSCLKVNTSCQYYKSEFTPIESRSTQYEKSSHRRTSSMQICSESGDSHPHRKKSVKILSGPYECPDFSETRYCMEPKRSISRSVVPLLDCNDDISKLCFGKPARVCLEMGDSCIPPPMEIRYAITKITKFRDFSTFEVMKSTSKKPKCMPKAVEGVFVLKKEENYCSSKTYE